VASAPLTFAFALPCYNEAQNLPALLPVLDQTRVGGRGPSRFVIASDEAVDGTDEIVRQFAQESSTPVQLISNPKRAGKCSAINQCLRELRDIDVIVLISGDVLPMDDAIRLLVQEFEDPKVGVTGGRSITVGTKGNLAFEITRFMWAMHHVISLKHPKTTEVTVFRNVIESVDWKSLVDEAEIELMIQRQGYQIRYLPEARIMSPSPLRLSDYIKQRSFVTLGYLRLKRKWGEVIKTHEIGERLRALAVVCGTKQFRPSIVLLAIAAEILIRVIGWFEFLAGRHRKGIWGRSESTKRSLVEGSNLSCDAEAGLQTSAQ
jgi:poly-beta-1,6-N-acetyl-D-glucosamine synthase